MATVPTSTERIPGCSATQCLPMLSVENAEAEQEKNCWETILLVEDELFVRDVTQEALEMCGYKVLTASDAAEGIRVFERHSGPVHLLVTDVVMPGMNGRELATRLLMRCPDLKTIYVSGYPDNTVVRDGAGVSQAAYLQKPFTLHALTRKVREIINSSTRSKATLTQ